MNIDQNIKLRWSELRNNAIESWRNDLDEIISNKMKERGFKIRARTGRTPIENNEVESSWAFSKNNMYIWISCMTHMGITANLFPEDQPKKVVRFPTQVDPEDNMSFDKFFEWLDKQRV